jgi:hypothetical protein
LQKVLNAWFGRALKKTFLIWKSYLGWRRGGKAMHIANINAWRRQRDLKNALKALRQICLQCRLRRKLGAEEPEQAASRVRSSMDELSGSMT